MVKLGIALLYALTFAVQALAQETLRLAVTTSFENSGLADVLLPEISEDLGIDVQLLVVGTGQALKLGRSGDVDALLVHSEIDEVAFVEGGFGTHRRPVMYNDFIIIGPDADPANLAATTSAMLAFAAIAANNSDFVSRGDDSGTHKRERAIWSAAGIAPKGSWYKEAGASMGAALNLASGLGAYVLADRASWLNFQNKAGMKVLVSGDPTLFNQYSFIPVDPERHAHVKFQRALELEKWLTSKPTADLIDGYQIDGQKLFVFNGE